MQDPGSTQRDLALLRDLIAVEIAELQARFDNTKLGWKPLSPDWRIATDHKRKAFAVALHFVLDLIALKRPGAGGFSACSRNFHDHGEPLPRALILQGFASAGFEPPAEYVANLDVVSRAVQVDSAEVAPIDGHDEKPKPLIDRDDCAAH